MPRYKKKRHNRIFNTPKKSVKPKRKVDNFDDIKMTSHKSVKENSAKRRNMHVVAGKKLERNRKYKSIIGFVAAILIIFFVFEAFLLAGVVQTVSNIIATTGTGSFPITLSGTKTYNTVTMGNYFYHLSDTHFSAYSNAGKKLFSEPHGFEKPVLTVSKGRALIYDQGANGLQIFDLKGLEYSNTTEREIISASISDSGSYAVATYSDEYASAVSVYSKKNKLIYEWYSAEDIINAIAFSSNGKRIAVASYKSLSGVFSSKLNVINCESKTATPEHTKTYENSLIYSLKNSNNRFCVIKSNGIDYIKWSNFDISEYKNDYSISKFRSNSSYNVAVFCRESDNTDNAIVIFSKKGKVKYTVKYKGIINDIQVKGSNIYCINDSEISVLDFEGNLSRSKSYGYGGISVAVTSTNTVAVISDSEIERVKLDKKD